jgi:hypothetical protein
MRIAKLYVPLFKGPSQRVIKTEVRNVSAAKSNWAIKFSTLWHRKPSDVKPSNLNTIFIPFENYRFTQYKLPG